METSEYLKQAKTLEYWPKNGSENSRSKGIILKTLVLTLKNKGRIALDQITTESNVRLGQLTVLDNGDYSHWNTLNQNEATIN